MDLPYLLYRLMKQLEVSSQSLMFGIWTALLSVTLHIEGSRRFSDVTGDARSNIGLEINGGKCELTIHNDSMPEN